MTEPLSAFILAAGFGERLRPITLQIPKPLLPAPDRPLLQTILERLCRLPVDEIGINLHYKRDEIRKWLTRHNYGNVRIFPEDPILGTGGGLKNAAAMLSRHTFLAHNADILTDFDLAGLVEAHRISENLVTLAVHDYPRFNSLMVDEKGFIRGIRTVDVEEPGRFRHLAFTGVAVYSPYFLPFLPQGCSSVVHAWREAMACDEHIGIHDVTGCYWSDIGTPLSYAVTVAEMMRKEGETVSLHRTVRGCENVEMEGMVVVGEDCNLDPDVGLRNCIVLPDTHVQAGTYENCIAGQDFTVPFEEYALNALSDSATPIPVGAGGSDRRYLRIRTDSGSAVRLQTTSDDPDFVRQMDYTRFFRRHGIPVPELLHVDTGAETAMFEDLGDLSLYSWRHCSRPVAHIRDMYRRILEMLVTLHTSVSDRRDECPLLCERVFDYAYLRWETDYFLERFLKGMQNLSLPASHPVREELHKLAMKVDSFPKTIVHRDMQSQNIMVTKGGIPRIIDYQGARIGPSAYDVASLLWDPYAPLDPSLRQRLLQYYVEEVSRRRKGFDKAAFLSTVLPCRLQRHMQALGAYGFLSLVKGKRYFLKFIPEGNRLLKDDLSEAMHDYPALHELVMGL